jgi:phosphate:Na+ symporter
MLTLNDFFLVAGGLGLFLFGMKMMSNGLELIAGNRLQGVLKKATANRFFAVGVGIVATIVINSSTATTIMTVSFVNSGMMNLTQAIGVIMGANVGTTFSAQMIALKVNEIAPLFIFVGVILYVFNKNTKTKNIGYAVLGFGILFFGVTVMGQPFTELSKDPGFQSMLAAFSNPFLAMLAGFAFTAIVQSSSATTGVLVTMHLNGVPIPFETSAFIILGTNIGTSITTVIASIPGNRESKRAALFHLMYDIIGCSVFGTLIVIFPQILGWFMATWNESARQVAMFHTLYNFATMFLLLPFIALIAKMMEKIVPKKLEITDPMYERKLLYLHTPLLQSRTLSIINMNNARLEIVRLGKIADESYRLATEAFFEKDENKAKKARNCAKLAEYLVRKIKAKLIEANSAVVSTREDERIQKMLTVLIKLSDIAEYAEKMIRSKKKMYENSIVFSETEIRELKLLSDTSVMMVNEAVVAYENNDGTKLPMIKSQGKMIKSMKTTCVENHMERYKNEGFKPEQVAVFSDMIKRLERGAERAKDIAASI